MAHNGNNLTRPNRDIDSKVNEQQATAKKHQIFTGSDHHDACYNSVLQLDTPLA